MAAQSPSFAILSAKYLEYLSARNLAPRTVKEYPQAIGRFLLYLESLGVEDMREVTLRHLQGYVNESSHLAPATQKARVDLLRNFFRFLHRTGVLYINLAQDLEGPKLPKRLPRGILDVHEINAMLKQPDATTFTGFRDKAILELLYSTGIRSSELCGLKLTDVDMQEDRLFILGKGRKEALVPFGEKAKAALAMYLKNGRPQVRTNEPFVFVSRWRGIKLSGRTLLDVIRRYAKKAGIEKKVFPHAFRHSCATHLLRNGADIRHIQQLLRHADLSSTQVYTRVDVADLKEAQKKYHPREQHT